MGVVKIPYYVVRKGRGYWITTKRMQAMGFPSCVRCGVHGPDAWTVAKEWNDRWQRTRTGMQDAPVRLWPHGSLGEAWDRFRRSRTWSDDKAPRTREDWERGWKHIGPLFGDVAPSTVTFENVDQWYGGLLSTIGIRESHRVIKIWRALWQVAAAMHYCDPNHDPSFGIRRKTPQGRSAIWHEGEVVRLVKRAWRMGYRGLAVAVAVMYDTSLSPGDVRSLCLAQSRQDARGVWFELGRAKTGREALGTLSKRSAALLRAYLDGLPAALLPEAPIIRTRTSVPYRKNSLAEDFRVVRETEFPGDTRKLLDMRRTGAVEAMAGEVDPGALSAKMANTLSDAKDLQRTYLPVNRATVDLADEARKRGRRRILENKAGRKVETVPARVVETGEAG